MSGGATGVAAGDRVDPARHVPIDDADADALRVVTRFFEAFARTDPHAMAACYHPMASYSNPVFPDLRGEQPGRMWALALADAQALRLDWSVAFADDRKAQVIWQAQWLRNGRAQRMEAASTLTLWDGVIVRQVDEFRFARWAGQRLGAAGLALSWLPAFQRTVQRRARLALARFSGRPA